MGEAVHLFGIRHHGPGCARSLVAALERLEPDCVLIEGPPEAEPLLRFVNAAEMVPPVALLLYDPEDPTRAVFYPFAEFSPEWQALRFAAERGVTTRFFDLPIAQHFGLEAAARERVEEDSATGVEESPEPAAEAEDPETPEGDAWPDGLLDPVDPLDWLGRAAGYGDGEAWWNHLAEERRNGDDLFAAISEAMTTVRAEVPPSPRGPDAERREMLREAAMRRSMRAAIKEGFERIAVVCGAWHVPALAQMPPAARDHELLAGLPKRKVEATWVPWSYRNLARASGYGAGVVSPSWYEFVWRAGDDRERSTRWLSRAAQLFRREDLDCSSAQVIDAVRLAETLAALRDRPAAGLDELSEAFCTVVCLGDSKPMELIHHQLVIGDRLGRIPPDSPSLPLQRDLEQLQRSLRMKPEAAQKVLDLDLRQPTHLERSHLLHRLGLLGIRWGVPSGESRRAKGTFHERWTLSWEPELALAVIEAARWGNTVEEAAARKAIEVAGGEVSVRELAELIDQLLLGAVEKAIGPVTHVLEDRAAVSGDVGELLEALPSLAAIVRYGNVRGTDAGSVMRVIQGVAPRISIGLGAACHSLDDDAAEVRCRQIRAGHKALCLIDEGVLLGEWRRAIASLAELGRSHTRVAGLAARILFDDREVGSDQVERWMGQALSIGTEPAQSAAWLEGFLDSSAMVLLHDDALFRVVDEWLGQLDGDHFVRIVALLRRTFTNFSAPERRQLGERARSRPSTQGATAVTWDTARADRVAPLLRALWGLER